MTTGLVAKRFDTVFANVIKGLRRVIGSWKTAPPLEIAGFRR